VKAVVAHRLVGVLKHLHLRVSGLAVVAAEDRLLPAEQEVVGLGARLELELLEVVPERDVHDRELADALALGEDREPAAVRVEVLELDEAQGALAETVVQEQAQGDAVATEVV
jgi:hypothetical protein